MAYSLIFPCKDGMKKSLQLQLPNAHTPFSSIPKPPSLPPAPPLSPCMDCFHLPHRAKLVKLYKLTPEPFESGVKQTPQIGSRFHGFYRDLSYMRWG